MGVPYAHGLLGGQLDSEARKKQALTQLELDDSVCRSASAAAHISMLKDSELKTKHCQWHHAGQSRIRMVYPS